MIRLIAALDRSRGIAKQGILPWNIPDDRKYFAQATRQNGGNILIGSVTFQALKKPFKDRNNYVLTRDKASIEGAEPVHDLEKFLRDWRDNDLWVVGGANVFSQVMELEKVDELYLCHIEADFGCNQFFPVYEDKFVLAEKSLLHEQNGFIYSYAQYTKPSAYSG